MPDPREYDTELRTNIRKRRRKQLQDLEEDISNDSVYPELGKHAGKGLKFLRETFLDPAEDDDHPFDVTGGMGGTVKIAGKSMKKLAKASENSRDTVYSKMKAMLRKQDTADLEKKIDPADFSSDVKIGDLGRKQKEDYVFFKATNQPDEVIKILREAKKKKDAIRKAEAAQPKQRDIYDKSTLTPVSPKTDFTFVDKVNRKKNSP